MWVCLVDDSGVGVVCMDSVMCGCVWLMIVVCVDQVRCVYVGGGWGGGSWGGGQEGWFSAVIIYIFINCGYFF